MIFKKVILAGGFLALASSFAQPAQACEECQLRDNGTYLGQFTLLGNGTVRSWVKFEGGKPQSLGITFSENALTGLKEAKDLPKEMPAMEYKLALPKEAKVTGFDHIGLDWNPIGHPPKDIYTLPHFDVHFYMMTPDERAKISAKGADLARCEKKPGAAFIPAGYIIPPETVMPQMGAHAVDTAAAELSGKTFTSTFIYGYYNGQMNFIEPMIAVDFLKTKPNFSSAVKVPKSYPKNGFYPTKYSVSFDPQRQEYSVALDGLTWHEATPLKQAVVKTNTKPATAKPVAKKTVAPNATAPKVKSTPKTKTAAQ